LSLPKITAPQLRQLYSYWLERRGDGHYPRRADFDPIGLRFILGNLILVDVIAGDPLAFRIRLHGSNLAHRHGYELTGKMLDELPVTRQRDLARLSFSRVVQSGVPLHALRDHWIDGRRQRYETIILPLSSDGTAIDMLLVGLIHADDGLGDANAMVLPPRSPELTTGDLL
jgi:hypothetical protein